jgi:D-sedoheptulose 7-phosphate isomerase
MDKNAIQNYIETGTVLRNSLLEQTDILMAVTAAIIYTFRNNGKVVIFGNGGSAADAQHIAAEFVSGCFSGGVSLPAIALTTNTSCLTAIANDYGYDDVFARQVQSLVKKGDVVIGISTSGKSINVLKAMKQANNIGAVTVFLTGKVSNMNLEASQLIAVPSNDTRLIQEIHITIGHLICSLVGEAFVTKKQLVLYE